jgi:5-methylcytosine-specific restriction endonuclease McrA
MNNKKLDAAVLWKQFEDVLVPTLGLSVVDRVVYSHLIRHTLVEGKRRIRFSIKWLAQGSGVTTGPARKALRRLAEKGAVRLMERTRKGHVIEVRYPDQIRAALEDGAPALRSRPGVAEARALPQPPDVEKVDFVRTRRLREAIHTRDRGLCFYCLCQVKDGARVLDHVVPRFHSGGNSYRNLVSCCLECNSQKRDKPAADFLRSLYREHRLTAAEFNARLGALQALANGKLRPSM